MSDRRGGASPIDFLHDGHVHPGSTLLGAKSGTFTIPTSGHDFQGNTRYRISLTVTDTDGISTTTSVIVWPEKVNLLFDTIPNGLTFYLDGVARSTPTTVDTLVGFNHTIEARNQTDASGTYTFDSWSDGGAQSHTITVPDSNHSYTARFTAERTARSSSRWGRSPTPTLWRASSSKRKKSWNAPVSLARQSCAGMRASGAPSTRMLPELGSYSLHSSLTSVLLPAPFSPTSATTEPAGS